MIKLPIGTIVLIEKPIAYVLQKECYKTHCVYCLERKKVFKCNSCLTTAYCSKACQANDWNDHHKHECKNFIKVDLQYRYLIPTPVHLICRIIYYLEKHDTINQNAYIDPELEIVCPKFNNRTLDSLMDHLHDIKGKTKECMDIYIMAVRKLLPYNIFKKYVSILPSLYGKILINTYTISDKDLQPIAIGIYIKGSYFNHSCDPNAIGDFVGPYLRITLNSNIELSKDDNSQEIDQKIFINYTQYLAPYIMRQTSLRQSYYFTCMCHVCCDPKLNPSNITESSKIIPNMNQYDLTFLPEVCKKELESLLSKQGILDFYNTITTQPKNAQQNFDIYAMLTRLERIQSQYFTTLINDICQKALQNFSLLNVSPFEHCIFPLNSTNLCYYQVFERETFSHLKKLINSTTTTVENDQNEIIRWMLYHMFYALDSCLTLLRPNKWDLERFHNAKLCMDTIMFDSKQPEKWREYYAMFKEKFLHTFPFILSKGTNNSTFYDNINMPDIIIQKDNENAYVINNLWNLFQKLDAK